MTGPEPGSDPRPGNGALDPAASDSSASDNGATDSPTPDRASWIDGTGPVGGPDVDPVDVQFMELALAEARQAEVHGDVPVGAVVVRNGDVIASRHNERELSGDPTAHAEILALRDAAAVVGSWHLTDCTLVVTLEPCLMCGGAAVNARLDRLVYGAADMAAGACLSLYNVCDDPRLNHTLAVTPGVLADDAGRLLREFFAAKR